MTKVSLKRCCLAIRISLIFVGLSIGIAGCSLLGSKAELPSNSMATDTGKETRKLEIGIIGNTMLNTDNMGRSFPVLVKVYELKSDNMFKNADFFSLQTNDKGVLQDDLLHKDEILLRPGKNAVIKRMYTGNRALHDINGLISMVISRSRRLSMIRVERIAGTLHPKPISKGINDLP